MPATYVTAVEKAKRAEESKLSKLIKRRIEAAKSTRRLYLGRERTLDQKSDDKIILKRGIPESVFATFSMRRWTPNGLTELWLCNQNLGEFPPKLKTLMNLRTLSLAGNGIKTLPAQINQLGKLERFILSRNEIETLPRSFADLFKLKELLLDANKFKTVPEEVCRVRSLKKLDMRLNSLSTLTTSLTKLSSLVELDLDGNKLTDVALESVDWSTMKSIKILGLSDNYLGTLPAYLEGGLPEIIVLRLDGNRPKKYEIVPVKKPGEKQSSDSLQKFAPRKDGYLKIRDNLDDGTTTAVEGYVEASFHYNTIASNWRNVDFQGRRSEKADDVEFEMLNVLKSRTKK